MIQPNLIKALRTYNGLSDDIAVTFDDRFNVPAELLEQYGLSGDLPIGVRYFHGSFDTFETEEENPLEDFLDFVADSDEENEIVFEVAGTGQDGRSQNIEYLSADDELKVVREYDNEFDDFAISIKSMSNKMLGYVPSDFSSVLAPVMDQDLIEIINVSVSSVTPLSKRSKRAKKAFLHAKLEFYLK